VGPLGSFDGGIFRILNGLISVLEKKWVLPFSADLEDRQKEIFCRIFMWDNARLPACPPARPWTRRALLPKSGQSLVYLSPCVGEPSGQPATAWLCITLCGQALLLHNMPLFMGAYTYTNGFSCRRMFDRRREKKEDL